MVDLNKEAEEYAHNNFEMHETNNYKALKQGFIAGGNSKFVKQQILQVQIDALSTLRLGINDDNTVTVFEIKDKIKQLQQKLKQL